MNYNDLKKRHNELESIINHAYKSYKSDEIVRKFKKEKLRIKQQIVFYEKL